MATIALPGERMTDIFDALVRAQAERSSRSAAQAGLRLATAESCTGGLIAAVLTEVAGSSDVFERGFVTYSNEAKTELLGVPPTLIATHGAVSREVARAMAEGALAHSAADIAVAVTGVAGPGGGTRGEAGRPRPSRRRAARRPRAPPADHGSATSAGAQIRAWRRVAEAFRLVRTPAQRPETAFRPAAP